MRCSWDAKRTGRSQQSRRLELHPHQDPSQLLVQRWYRYRMGSSESQLASKKPHFSFDVRHDISYMPMHEVEGPYCGNEIGTCLNQLSQHNHCGNENCTRFSKWLSNSFLTFWKLVWWGILCRIILQVFLGLFVRWVLSRAWHFLPSRSLWRAKNMEWT